MLRAYPSKMEYLMEKEFVKEVCGEEVEEELAGHHESHDLNLVKWLLLFLTRNVKGFFSLMFFFFICFRLGNCCINIWLT